MIILRKKHFTNRVRSLQNLIRTDPSSIGAHRAICARTRRIIEAHAHGLEFLTIDRARLLHDNDQITIEWKYVRRTSLSEEDLRKWNGAVRRIAFNVRSGKNNVTLKS